MWNLSRVDLEVDIGEALEVLLHEAFRVVLSDLLPSHFCFAEEEYLLEKFKYCSVF